MAYDIMSINGFVAGGPSTTGWRNLKSELNTKVDPKNFPAIGQFIQYGESDKPLRLANEFKVLATKMTIRSVKQTCLEMANAAAKCEEIVILHNHIG
jgi:hypothetical protein